LRRRVIKQNRHVKEKTRRSRNSGSEYKHRVVAAATIQLQGKQTGGKRAKDKKTDRESRGKSVEEGRRVRGKKKKKFSRSRGGGEAINRGETEGSLKRREKYSRDKRGR